MILNLLKTTPNYFRYYATDKDLIITVYIKKKTPDEVAPATIVVEIKGE